jgi:hypothetical protein
VPAEQQQQHTTCNITSYITSHVASHKQHNMTANTTLQPAQDTQKHTSRSTLVSKIRAVTTKPCAENDTENHQEPNVMISAMANDVTV